MLNVATPNTLGAQAVPSGTAQPLPTAVTPFALRTESQRSIAGLGQTNEGLGTTFWISWGLISTASMAASAFHGYRRHDALWGALVWGLAGFVFPVITPVIAIAQGFGQRR